MLMGIPCIVMRGGTSTGPFFLASDLPEDPARRDRKLLAVMGSAHVRQIDGMLAAVGPFVIERGLVRTIGANDATHL